MTSFSSISLISDVIMTSFRVAVNIDDCADMDMVNGRCFDMVAAFEIVCDSGFVGDFCGGEIKTCDT